MFSHLPELAAAEVRSGAASSSQLTAAQKLTKFNFSQAARVTTVTRVSLFIVMMQLGHIFVGTATILI